MRPTRSHQANALLPRPSHLRACKSCERVGVLCSYNCFVRIPVSPQTPCLSLGAWHSETAKCGSPAFAVSQARLRSESFHTARVDCEFRFVSCRSFTSSHSVGLRFSLRIKAARVESGTHFFSPQHSLIHVTRIVGDGNIDDDYRHTILIYISCPRGKVNE